MLSSPQTLSAKPAALPPAMPSPLPGSGSAGQGPSFAQFLNTQPEMPTPPAHTDPVPHAPDSAPEAAAAPAPSPAANAPARRPASASSQAKPAAPAPKGTADAPQATKDAKACEDSDATADATSPDDAGKDDPETSGLTEFTQLIGLAAPTQQAAEAAAGEAAAKSLHGPHGGHATPAKDDGDPAASRTETNAVTQQPAERKAAEASARAADAQPRTKSADLAAAADKLAAHGTGSTETLQAAASTAADKAHAAAAPDAALPNFSAVLAQALPAATTASADVASPTAQAQVHAAMHSNAFGAELGARVSLLAVDGQQSAELQLNPADMGPVAVQIVVDGSQAQVSFHAVQAETRAALEKSLPDLAAALQGQGLTLSGGGVFQQAPKDSGGTSDREESTGRSARAASSSSRVGAAGPGTAAAPSRRTVGLLDTFA